VFKSSAKIVMIKSKTKRVFLKIINFELLIKYSLRKVNLSLKTQNYYSTIKVLMISFKKSKGKPVINPIKVKN